MAILKSNLRKSPVAKDVDLDFLAKMTKVRSRPSLINTPNTNFSLVNTFRDSPALT